MDIVWPIMVYDMTEWWRDTVKSMHRSVGDRYLFEANVTDRPAIAKSGLQDTTHATFSPC